MHLCLPPGVLELGALLSPLFPPKRQFHPNSQLKSSLPPLADNWVTPGNLIGHAYPVNEKADLLGLFGQMLRKHLFTVLCLVLPDKPRIPQFTRNPQILAAPHQGIAFARLGGCGDTGWVKVFLFASSY